MQEQFELTPPPEKVKYAAQARWAARNRDKCNAKSSAWAKTNRDSRNETRRKYEAKNRESVVAYQKERHKRTWPLIRDKENAKRREKYFQQKYGVSLAELDVIAEQQKGLCLICSKPFGERKRRHIDHCHKTGKVRGVLCSRCNQGLGLFKEDVFSLQRAISYIIRNNFTESIQ